MMNRSLLVFMAFLLALPHMAFSQGSDKYESKLKPVRKEKQYIHGLTMSPDRSLIAYGVASFRVVAINRDYEQKKRFFLTGMWGGGGACFSHDSKQLAYYSYGEKDTLTIYNFETDKAEKHVVDNIEGIQFYNSSAQILCLDKDKVSIFSLEKSKIIKTKKFGDYIDDIQLTDDDQSAFVLFSDGRLSTFSTKNWKELKEVASFDKTVSNLCITDSYFIANAEGEVIIVNRSSGEKSTYQSGFSYICDIEILSPLVVVAGRSPYVFMIDLDTGKTEEDSIDVTPVGIFSLLSMGKDGMLVGDGNSIYMIR